MNAVEFGSLLPNSRKVDRLEARYVAKSYTLAEGVDYENTFSSVKAMVTVRSLLTISPTNGWRIEQLGVNNIHSWMEIHKKLYNFTP